jgi:hypothetical protein
LKLNNAESESSILKEEIVIPNETLTELLKATVTKGSSFRFEVKGFSMSPFIKDKDVVTIAPLSNPSIGLGTAVGFIHPATKRFIIHRLIAKSANSYLIKGDNILGTDSLVPRDNILGYVSKVERNGKRVFLSLGIERFLIAFLSRVKIFPIIFWSWRLIPLPVRRLIA